MNYDVCVVGGTGHIGLPLAIAFANEGKKVIACGRNQEKIDLINQGKMPFMEEGSEEVLKKVIKKTLFLSSNLEVIKNSKFIIIATGTPVDEHLNPRYTDMKKFFEEITQFFKNDHIVVLRSTLYPTTTGKIQELLKKDHPKIEVTFCPERLAEGKAMEELYTLPQIVSGFSEKGIREVSKLFSLLTKDILVVSPLEAELAKLFTNSWRYIQFAAANQFYTLAEDYGVDFYKIYDVMKYKYPRTKTFPKAGFAAGPCLFKDTMQISAFSNNKFFLGHAAMLMNEGLPNFIVESLKKQYPLAEKTVGILGMAFKAENDDKRESLSYKLRKILEIESKETLCSDAYIKEDYFVSEEELIKKSDIIIIGAPHKRYKNLDYKNKLVIDIWNLRNKRGISDLRSTE